VLRFGRPLGLSHHDGASFRSLLGAGHQIVICLSLSPTMTCYCVSQLAAGLRLRYADAISVGATASIYQACTAQLRCLRELVSHADKNARRYLRVLNDDCPHAPSAPPPSSTRGTVRVPRPRVRAPTRPRGHTCGARSIWISVTHAAAGTVPNDGPG